MTANEIKHVLLWCVGLNYAILFVWFGVFVFAHDWMYRMHGHWFKLQVETFDAIHYAGLAIYKRALTAAEVHEDYEALKAN